jgi:hypothetical protein
MDMGYGRPIKTEYNRIKVITQWIKSQGMEFILGIMVGFTKAISRMIIEMVMENFMNLTKQ